MKKNRQKLHLQTKVDLCEIYRLWNMSLEVEKEIERLTGDLDATDHFKFFGWDIEYLIRVQYNEV